MSKPLEGLSEVSSMENSEESKKTQDLNLKATELRLGLPGSESPEREHGPLVEEKNGFSVGVVKSFVSGAKRGFSDAINGGSGNWGFSGSGGSGVDLAKCGGLLSPKGFNGGAKILGPQSNTQQPAMASTREKIPQVAAAARHGVAPAAKEQVVGWPPIRSFRKNSMVASPPKIEEDVDGKPGLGCLYVKVSMDGAPYLRKVDLKNYNCYKDLTLALKKMFSSFTMGQCGSQGIPTRGGLSESRLLDLHGSEYALTFEDKDGDWMLVGDLPWEMFVESCKRLRIMKSSDDVGLGPRATEKCESR